MSGVCDIDKYPVPLIYDLDSLYTPWLCGYITNNYTVT